MPEAPLVVHVVRDVDGTVIEYDRSCREDELDGIIACEQNEAGTVLELTFG